MNPRRKNAIQRQTEVSGTWTHYLSNVKHLCNTPALRSNKFICSNGIFRSTHLLTYQDLIRVGQQPGASVWESFNAISFNSIIEIIDERSLGLGEFSTRSCLSRFRLNWHLLLSLGPLSQITNIVSPCQRHLELLSCLPPRNHQGLTLPALMNQESFCWGSVIFALAKLWARKAQKLLSQKEPIICNLFQS